MGGLTSGIGYIAAAFTVGYLLKSTDYISYKIDERRSANRKKEELVAMALQARRGLHQHAIQSSAGE